MDGACSEKYNSGGKSSCIRARQRREDAIKMDIMEMSSKVWSWWKCLLIVSAEGLVWFSDSASIEQVHEDIGSDF
jgi:hypothetical protein